MADDDMADDDMAGHDMADDATGDQVVVVAPEPVSTDSVSVTPTSDDAAPVDGAPTNSDQAPASPTSTATETATETDSDSAPASSTPATSAPATSVPTDSSAPATSAPATPPLSTVAPSDPAPTNPNPVTADYSDITTFGVFHGTSSHTHGDSLAGGRTAITTEALVVYNDLRAFHGLDEVQPEAIGRWAFANNLTNNSEAYGEELTGVGLYYGMQGAKVGWIRDGAFDPQILADIQRTAREGGSGEVMTMVEAFGHSGYADHLTRSGLVDAFVNTLKMEPHYGGWMHGRVHGALPFSDGTGKSVATAHDINHLTVLSHDQQQAFMNDTFDWPQWPALDVPESVVLDYFQSMVVLGDPHSDSL
jgi:endoglucanase